MDQGTAVGLQATGLGITLGALLYTGHARAMQRVAEDRAAREWAAYEGSLHAEIAGLRHRLRTADAEVAALRRKLFLSEAYERHLKRKAGR